MIHPQNPLTKFEELNAFNIVADRISFVLYGSNQLYFLGAIHNAILAPKIFPNWICRFYIDKVGKFCNILKELNCEIFCAKNPKIGINCPDPKMWRMYAMDDDRVRRVIFRDTDSLLSVREKSAVDEWINSGKKFHRIKDANSHYVGNLPILTGLWGSFESTFLITKLIARHSWKGYNPAIDTRKQKFRPRVDEHFIHDVLWPKIKDDCFFHGIRDDEFGKAHPLTQPFQAVTDFNITETGFIGARIY